MSAPSADAGVGIVAVILRSLVEARETRSSIGQPPQRSCAPWRGSCDPCLNLWILRVGSALRPRNACSLRPNIQSRWRGGSKQLPDGPWVAPAGAACWIGARFTPRESRARRRPKSCVSVGSGHGRTDHGGRIHSVRVCRGDQVLPLPSLVATFHRSKNPRRRACRLRIVSKRAAKPDAFPSRAARSRRSTASSTASS